MPDLLLELFSEEIPARMQARAADDLGRLVCDGLRAAELAFSKTEVYATPRRLCLPITDIPAAQPDTPTAAPPPRTASDRALEVRLAWASTLVVSPLFVLILVFGLTSQVLVLVFVALLSVQPDLSRGVAGGMGLIAGNLLGGGIAIVLYELVVILPDLLFLTLMIALVCLVLGRRIFKGGAAGGICATALTTVLLIIGMTVAPIGPDADAKFLGRIVQVMCAALYVAGAFSLVGAVIRKGGIPKESDPSAAPA